MRILFVTARFPFPPHRGDQARAYHQLRLLAPRHGITLLCYASPGVDERARQAIAPFCEEVITVPLRTMGRLAGAARAAVAGRPLQSGLYRLRSMRQVVARLLRDQRHDLLHVQLARMAALFDGLDTPPRLLDLVDALSLNMARRAAHDRGPARWLAGLEEPRLRRYERALCADWDHVTVASGADRQIIGDFPNLTVNPNGVDLERFPFLTAPRPPGTVVFTGNLGYYPNVDAAVWLVREVFPPIRKTVGAARLQLVGARPARRVRALAGREGVELYADVSDMAAHLAGARVAVAPLRAGSGQLLKVLEAMACGTPVVATPLAVAGLEVEDGRHVLLAETAEGLAAQTLRLLQDEALASRLAFEARALVESRHTWQRSVAGLESLYHRVLGEP